MPRREGKVFRDRDQHINICIDPARPRTGNSMLEQQVSDQQTQDQGCEHTPSAFAVPFPDQKNNRQNDPEPSALAQESNLWHEPVQPRRPKVGLYPVQYLKICLLNQFCHCILLLLCCICMHICACTFTPGHVSCGLRFAHLPDRRVGHAK